MVKIFVLGSVLRERGHGLQCKIFWGFWGIKHGLRFFSKCSGKIWPCLDPKFLHPKTSHRIFGHMHRVLNEVYLQNFLYGWAVNRETNLMSLLNP